MSEALTVVAPESAIVEADPQLVVSAFRNYQEIQKALDETMPDCIQHIGDKKFRKKSYWRAIATAFNLQLDLVHEQREDLADDDWGYLVTYRATARNGRYCDGDGSCFASEKYRGQDTVHNVRAHAHTRAKNRAIADLVGFGEVSAEEVQNPAKPAAREHTAPSESQQPVSPAPTSEQVEALKLALTDKAEALLERAAIAELDGAPQDDASMREAIKATAFDFLSMKTLTEAKQVNALLAAIGNVELDDSGGPVVAHQEDPFD